MLPQQPLSRPPALKKESLDRCTLVRQLLPEATDHLVQRRVSHCLLQKELLLPRACQWVTDPLEPSWPLQAWLLRPERQVLGLTLRLVTEQSAAMATLRSTSAMLPGVQVLRRSKVALGTATGLWTQAGASQLFRNGGTSQALAVQPAMAQVDAERALNDHDQAVVARAQHLDAGERPEEDLALVRVL